MSRPRLSALFSGSEAAPAAPLAMFLTGAERAQLLAVIEELHLALSVRGVPVVRGSVCGAVVQLARIAAGEPT